MKVSNWLTRALAGLLTIASGAVLAADGSSGRRPAYATTDAATGAAVRVYRVGGLVSLEIDHPMVQIRKLIVDGGTTTTLRTATEEVAIALTRDAVTVTSPKGSVQAGRTHPERVRDVQALLAASPAAAAAAGLIGRLQLPADSPVSQTLSSTRALILSSKGDDAGARDIARTIGRIERARAGAVTVPVSEAEQGGPGTCWTLYAIEAIAAYIEYEGCMNGEEWWDLFGQISCAVIYEMRAIGAFAWWLSCVGLRG
jgi:hypothetical protein